MLDVADLRRVAGWALVGGLCVSAAVAIVALLTDAWSDLSWKVVGTSLGFSVFTSTAAAGAALLVITLLATVLPTILRRLGRRERRDEPAAAAAFGASRPAGGLAGEVAEVAARLEAMDLPPHARREVDRLRQLARDAGA